MAAALDAETGLAPISKELWEERDISSTYACAATWGAFHETAQLASALGDPQGDMRWQKAADALHAAIATHLWDEETQRFMRGRKLLLTPHMLNEMRDQPTFAVADAQELHGMGKYRYMLARDARIDISILGLSVPFGVFPADDPRMRATADAIATELRSPVGGIYRYPHDHYRGGNPWILTTLWLAWQDAASGQHERANESFQWALEHRTALDLLPEQIDKATGEPCWVVPLGWSHAMYLLAAHAFGQSA